MTKADQERFTSLELKLSRLSGRIEALERQNEALQGQIDKLGRRCDRLADVLDVFSLTIGQSRNLERSYTGSEPE